MDWTQDPRWRALLDLWSSLQPPDSNTLPEWLQHTSRVASVDNALTDMYNSRTPEQGDTGPYMKPSFPSFHADWRNKDHPEGAPSDMFGKGPGYLPTIENVLDDRRKYWNWLQMSPDQRRAAIEAAVRDPERASAFHPGISHLPQDAATEVRNRELARHEGLLAAKSMDNYLWDRKQESPGLSMLLQRFFGGLQDEHTGYWGDTKGRSIPPERSGLEDWKEARASGKEPNYGPIQESTDPDLWEINRQYQGYKKNYEEGWHPWRVGDPILPGGSNLIDESELPIERRTRGMGGNYGGPAALLFALPVLKELLDSHQYQGAY